MLKPAALFDRPGGLVNLPAASGGGGGNAVVPEDAPIQPPQAFVDAQPLIAASQTGGALGLDLSSLVLTRLTGSRTSAIAIYLLVSGGSVAGSSLPTTDVDNLLSEVASGGGDGNGGTLNLSGPNMGVPTPAQVPVPCDVVLTIDQANAVGGDLLDLFGRDGTYEFPVSLDSGTALADSSFTNGYRVTIGTSDSPSDADVAAKIAEIATANLTDTFIASGATLHIVTGFSLTDGLGNAVVASGTLGTPFSKNADITTIVGNGGTVVVEEYVNRVSGPKEAVTYSP